MLRQPLPPANKNGSVPAETAVEIEQLSSKFGDPMALPIGGTLLWPGCTVFAANFVAEWSKKNWLHLSSTKVPGGTLFQCLGEWR